ncbi:MAG: hypothetical protein ACR2HX_02515 [Pyrinomonadaceae bacterium]
MTEPNTSDEIADVPARVFENFIEALRDADLSAELIARLHKTLVDDQNVTEGALRAAVLGEEPLP